MTRVRRRIHWWVPAVAIGLALAVGLARWGISTGPRAGFPAGAFIVGGFWLYIERAMTRGDDAREPAVGIHSWHRIVFAATGGYLCLGSTLGLLADIGVLGPGATPTARRGMGLIAGLMLALWGNYLPKLLSPWRSEDEPFDWQGVHRTVGWLASVGGGVIAFVWLFLPIAEASAVSNTTTVAVCGLALTVKLVSVVIYAKPRRGVGT